MPKKPFESKVDPKDRERIEDLWRRADEAVKVDCPPTCNHCCKNGFRWCTPLELQLIEEYLEEKRIRLMGWKKGCAWSGEGRCLVYPVRPLICRIGGPPQIVTDIEWIVPESPDMSCGIVKIVPCRRNRLRWRVDAQKLVDTVNAYMPLFRAGAVRIGISNLIDSKVTVKP